jgi:glycine oxidase
MDRFDICIAGAGLIGLALALELEQKGRRVVVLERSSPLGEASSAAAGMLAAHDPHNPAALRPLSDLSVALYPEFLDRLHALSGHSVPFQTNATLQSLPPSATEASLSENEISRLLPALRVNNRKFVLLEEQSVDPRQLAQAVLAAVKKTSIDLRPHTPALSTRSGDGTITVDTPSGEVLAHQFVDCTGSWNISRTALQVAPKKGQLLYLSLPQELSFHTVIRTPEIYIVPRTQGPNAGRVLVGATEEDAGFDKTVRHVDIEDLCARASFLLPALRQCQPLESWAGLRPGTPDDLPLLGRHPEKPHHYIATGHYRNGILLAPATARVMSQLLCGEVVSLDLAPYSPGRAAGMGRC